MKRNLSLFVLLIGATSILSCKNKSDNFVGLWVNCENPTPKTTFLIKKVGSNYMVENEPGKFFKYEKLADEILEKSDDYTTIRLTYDKQTNHLIMAFPKGVNISALEEQGWSPTYCKKSK